MRHDRKLTRICAVGITQIVNLLSNLNTADVRFLIALDDLNEYMVLRHGPADIQYRVIDFYQFKRNHNSDYLYEDFLFENLPNALR